MTVCSWSETSNFISASIFRPSSHHAESCELTETIPSEIHCISSSDSSSGHLSVPTQSILYNLLLERSWQDAMNLIEKDPSQAREWHYGIENDTLTSDEGPSLWKRLALHLACSVAAPVGLIDLLIHIHPNAVGCCDPHTGSIPLHLACQFGASLEVIRTLIRARSTTTKAMDTQGKLPLHYAILSSSSYATIELLVHHDPATVLCPDQGGKTPLQYAQHSYPVGSPVIGLLELVWM